MVNDDMMTYVNVEMQMSRDPDSNAALFTSNHVLTEWVDDPYLSFNPALMNKSHTWDIFYTTPSNRIGRITSLLICKWLFTVPLPLRLGWFLKNCFHTSVNV